MEKTENRSIFSAEVVLSDVAHYRSVVSYGDVLQRTSEANVVIPQLLPGRGGVTGGGTLQNTGRFCDSVCQCCSNGFPGTALGCCAACALCD